MQASEIARGSRASSKPPWRPAVDLTSAAASSAVISRRITTGFVPTLSAIIFDEMGPWPRRWASTVRIWSATTNFDDDSIRYPFQPSAQYRPIRAPFKRPHAYESLYHSGPILALGKAGGAEGEIMHVRAFDIAVTLGSLCLLGFFGWHGFHGPRSFANQALIEAEVARLEGELAKVSAERAARDA